MVCVVGEALIDLVLQPAAGIQDSATYLAHPGGSPYNVAIGLARLGQPSRLIARLSSDAFGRQLRTHAAANGVDLSLTVDAAEHATVAVVSLDTSRNAAYDFYRTQTADWQWTEAELARIPADAGWVHTGSLASWTPPGADAIEARLAELAELAGNIISFDPNIRPALVDDHATTVKRIERLVGLATVVKASTEDLAWLYPDASTVRTLHHWRELGPSVVVVTDGEKGAMAIGGDAEPFSVAARPINVVDTVGAGDAFMAGLLNALMRDQVLIGETVDIDRLKPAIDEAILVAALTCARAGANPPTVAELAAAN